MATDLSGVVSKISKDLNKSTLEKGAKPDDMVAFQDAYKAAGTSNHANNPFFNFVADARKNYNSKLEKISSFSQDTSPVGVAKVQYAISSMMVTQDLMAKAVGKANQTLETLLKMQ